MKSKNETFSDEDLNESVPVSSYGSRGPVPEGPIPEESVPEEHIERFIPSPPRDLLNYEVSSSFVEVDEPAVQEPVPGAKGLSSYSPSHTSNPKEEPVVGENPTYQKPSLGGLVQEKSIVEEASTQRTYKSPVPSKPTTVYPPLEIPTIDDLVDSSVQVIANVGYQAFKGSVPVEEKEPIDSDQDFPQYSDLPPTEFRCSDQKHSGYYADVSAGCQMFHVCYESQQWSFLCPNGTIFSQEDRVCVWWSDFDCSRSPSLYELNSNFFDAASLEPLEPLSLDSEKPKYGKRSLGLSDFHVDALPVLGKLSSPLM